MSVHYKFKSALEYDTVTFDGLHISVKDLKNAIIQQKRIGKSTDFDLQVTNAQTKEVYEDENALIPKNASLLIARIPVILQKNKTWEGYGGDNTPPAKLDEGGPIAKEVDLSSLDAPEDDKIRAMMSQSTQDYDPSNYMKIRGANQVGAVPGTYKCYKCHQGGHWIKDCTFGMGTDPGEIKKSTGIPRSFMVAVDGPQVPGAMMTPNGQFAVPLVDHQAYNQKPGPPMPVQAPKMDIPEELVCSICSDLLTDAVMIACCGNSFCDECIRGVLLDSEDHECPDCHEKDISPDTLIPNRFLRTSVTNFKNSTGYVKIPVYRERKHVTTVPLIKEGTPPRSDDVTKVDPDSERQTVISEADSTEPFKNRNADGTKNSEKERIDGPPGVSPKGSPKNGRKYSKDSPRSPLDAHSRHRSRSRSRSLTPKRSPRRNRSRSRSGSRSRDKKSSTPTRDESIGVVGANNYPQTTYGNSNLAPVPPMQGPPPIPGNYPPIGTFPAQGPPPNYRFPPPGGGPYMGGPYNMPRGMFDGSRPPLGGHPNYQNFPPGSRGHRDYNRRMLDRAPPGVIDDPLAAFNKLLREKDEQKRRAKQRGFRRSYSRSRSRSRSFSRSPVRRRSRSPRASRRSRSRSRSFSLSRSRSRSFSGSVRGSPHRQLSPARRSPSSNIPPRRGSRYRSPIRSPLRSRNRDRDYDDDREYDRNDRRDTRRNRDRRGSRDRDRFFDNFDEKRGNRVTGQWGQPRGVQENYFPPQPGFQTNRFGQPREFGPPFMNKEPPFNQPLPQTIHSIQPQRQYQDIAPPGVDDDIAPPGVEEPPFKTEKKDVKKEDKTDRRKETALKKRSRHDKRSRTPERIRSPRRKSKSKEREKESPDKHKKKRRDSSDIEEEEKYKKTKEKKKHKEKKESEKKKKRDKKEKHKKESKEKKAKDSFRQVIPKTRTTDEEGNKIIDKKRSEKGSKKDNKHIEKEIDNSPTKEDILDESEKSIAIIDVEDGVIQLDPLTLDNEVEIAEQPLLNTIPNQMGTKVDLYGDVLIDIDANVVENYGKIDYNSPFEGRLEGNKPAPESDTADLTEDGEIKDFEEEEKDVLELHTTDIDLKSELEKNDILAPVPEKSKWEVDDDGTTSPKDSNNLDIIIDKNGKVTNEVLKRAENAIFAKAINAIRPMDIKKIGADRAKLYSGEKELTDVVVQVKTEITKPRVSVKERLGVKVEDPDKIINLSARSRTISPFTRRGESGRNITIAERRVDIDYNKRNRRSRSSVHNKDKLSKSEDRHHRDKDKRADRSRRDKNKRDDKNKSEDEKKSKRKRSRTRSLSEDKKEKHKKKDKKNKKDKLKKKEDDKSIDKDDSKSAAAKRKSTIDEASFEPDYDESHSEIEDEEKVKKKSKRDTEESSSSESESSSSSEEERKKKRRKKHRKKKKRETSSSSSSSSSEESDSSDSERERKRKKHKKNKKKKKKAKHK